MSTPQFVGDFGADLESIEYYEIPEAHTPEDDSLRSPSYSWMRCVFPFSKYPETLHKNLITSYSRSVRFGRLLEIMDFMAGRVCYRHCDPTNPDSQQPRGITIVTASVDDIEFYPTQLSIDEDMKLEAYITYTGSSSMEVRIDVLNHKDELFSTSFYVMVARDNKTGKSAKVPKMDFSEEPDQKSWFLRNELGKRRQARRILDS